MCVCVCGMCVGVCEVLCVGVCVFGEGCVRGVWVYVCVCGGGGGGGGAKPFRPRGWVEGNLETSRPRKLDF